MRMTFLALSALVLVAACGPTITQACAEKHGDSGSTYDACVKIGQTKILTGPGSAFAKSRRGGGG